MCISRILSSCSESEHFVSCLDDIGTIAWVDVISRTGGPFVLNRILIENLSEGTFTEVTCEPGDNCTFGDAVGRRLYPGNHHK